MLNRQTTALLVIDVQGRLARIVNESESLIANIQRLIRGATILDLPVIWIEQNPEGLGDTVPELAELLPRIPPGKNHIQLVVVVF